MSANSNAAKFHLDEPVAVPNTLLSTKGSCDDSTILSLNAARRSPEANADSGLISVVSTEELTQSLPIEAKPKPQGAYELKFLIDEDRAQRVIEWARKHLDRDPHAGGECGDVYDVNSLYLDTPNLDVFHRSELFKQQKYRLRRYGQESTLWMEVKKKRRGLVRKQRVAVDQGAVVQRLIEPADMEWEGAWFRARLDEQSLRPVSQVTYRRFARVGTTTNGTMRLTVDSNLTGCLAEGWQVSSGPLQGISLLDGQRILELKFQVVMPPLFQQLVMQELLLTTSFSKYRTSVEECVPLDWIAGEA